MRKALVYLILIVSAIVLVCTYLVSTCIGLLFETGLQWAIQPNDLPLRDAWREDQRPIPKIIHQTWKNETIPEQWSIAHYTCLDLHPDYQYILWTDASSREFIAKEYPWFLKTFDSYQFNIERADVIRYFALYHYGGIYLDLDLGCHRRLDPLRTYSLWLRRTDPTGISNDAMGSTPHHLFLSRVIDHLQTYAHSWVLPYLTVMLSTGPLFLSIQWKEYIWSKPARGQEVSVFFPDWFDEVEQTRFFSSFGGSSWHKYDVAFIFWAEKHWMLLTVIITSIVLSILACIYFISTHAIFASCCSLLRRFRIRARLRRKSADGEYEPVREEDFFELDRTEKGARSPHQE